MSQVEFYDEVAGLASFVIEGEEYSEDGESAVVPVAVLKRTDIASIPYDFDIEICESQSDAAVVIKIPAHFKRIGEKKFHVWYEELITRKYWDGVVGLKLLMETKKGIIEERSREIGDISLDYYDDDGAYICLKYCKVKGTSNVYCTAEHDSLKISNGKWYWWSRGFGGYSALDYLIKVKEYDFVEAVEILTGQTMADWKPPPDPKKDEPKVLLLPPKNKDCNRVIQYLFGRGIDYQLIQECVADGTLYESADYHNAVFIGKDESGTPKYAALRSTLGNTFKQDVSGSDKRYLFRLLAREPTDTVHLFEAAIDLLSYATYLKCEGKDYKSESLLSLSGVYQPKKEMKDSKIPIALTTFLSANPQIKTIVLYLDNDKVGRLCISVEALEDDEEE